MTAVVDNKGNVSVLCRCGSPITHTTDSGMHCSNPKCNEEQISDNIKPDFEAAISSFDETNPLGSLNKLFGDMAAIVKKHDQGGYE